MEKGDRFIYYGAIVPVKGRVERTFTKVKYDIANGVKVIHEYIISEEGTTYDANECLRIDSEIGFAFLRRLLSIMKRRSN